MSDDLIWRRNYADGGANGATATIASSDDNGGDILSISTNGTRQYSNAYHHPVASPTSFYCYGNSSTQTIQGWDTNVSVIDYMWSSWSSYLWIPSAPPTECVIHQARANNAVIFDIRILTNRKIKLTSVGGSTLWTSDEALTAGQMYRIAREIGIGEDTSSGYVNFGLFDGDGATPIDGLDDPIENANLGILADESDRWGKLTTAADWGLYFGPVMQVNDTEQFGLLGPYAGDPALTLIQDDIVDVDCTGSNGTLTLEQISPGPEAIIYGPFGDVFRIKRPPNHTNVLVFRLTAHADGPPSTRLIKLYPRSLSTTLQFNGGDPSVRDNWS